MSSDIKDANLNIALPPRQSGNVRKAIEGKLQELISQYVPEIDGILIKWSDLNVLNDKGIIIDDQPYIFYKVSFRAHLFKPVEGKLVRAKVHRILKTYFLAIAMTSFTVIVSIPENFRQLDVIKSLSVDQDVYFKMKGSSEGVYRGELDENCIELIEGLVKEEQETNAGAYDYARDFEY